MKDNFLKRIVSDRLSRMGVDRPKIPNYNYRGRDEKIPSHGMSFDVAAKPETKTYTGSEMIGIATMHKSNSIPVFSKETAIDLAKMRR